MIFDHMRLLRRAVLRVCVLNGERLVCLTQAKVLVPPNYQPPESASRNVESNI